MDHFQCKYCQKEFKKKRNVREHEKAVHKRNVSGDIIETKSKESVICGICKKKFANGRSLSKHKKNIHTKEDNRKKYSCSKCYFHTAYQNNFKRHILQAHKKIDEENASVHFMCCQCAASFKQLNRLKYHERTIHRIGEKTIKRKCPICTYVSEQQSKDDIHIHFEKIHNIPVRKTFYKFNSVEEFHSWKCKIEKETTTCYIKNVSRENYTYYRCHRHGYHKSKGHAKRALKQSGSCKINGYCPASMKLKATHNEVSVVYIDTHVGHKNDLKYIRLSSEEKLSIALQLASKTPHKEILKSIRGSIPNSGLRRIHLTNKKDIINIENSFNLRDEAVKKHLFDPVSITSWVKELSNSDNTALVVNEPQGELIEEEILKHTSKPINQSVTIDEELFKMNQGLETLKSHINTIEQAHFVQNEIKRLITTIDAMNLPSTHSFTVKVTSFPSNKGIEKQRDF